MSILLVPLFERIILIVYRTDDGWKIWRQVTEGYNRARGEAYRLAGENVGETFAVAFIDRYGKMTVTDHRYRAYHELREHADLSQRRRAGQQQ